MKLQLTKGKDVITVEVLPDGSIKTTADGTISSANHGSAEHLFRQLATAGKSTRERLKGRKAHTHTHSHSHQEEEA